MIYINGIGNISPQATFDQTMGNDLAMAEGAFFACQEPQYKDFIQKKLLRRMSRIVRMGLAASHKALEQANNPIPDAIITGTAWGCVKDTEKFLETIIENNEEYLTPTAFVQSTHNTVAGQVALMQHNNCYNMTYVQGYVSFESGLIDAILHFKDSKAKNVLVGGIDEQSEQLQTLLERLKCAIPEQHPMGEGAAFFLLSNEKTATSYAQLAGANMLYKPKDAKTVQTAIQHMLEQAGLQTEDIDVVLTGNKNAAFEQQLFKQANCSYYKNLCGDYPTSTSFAMALGAHLIKGDLGTKTALNIKKEAVKHVLIYNNHQDINHSIILLSWAPFQNTLDIDQ